MHLQRLFYLILTTLLVTGCFNMASEVTVRPDGSGTVSERLVMNAELAQMLRQMEEMDSTSSSKGLFSKADVRARADSVPGLELASIEMISGAEGEGYEAVYRFDNLNALQFNPSPDDVLPDAPDEQPSGDAPFDLLSNVRLSHTPGSPATLTVTMPRSDDQGIGPSPADTSEAPSNQEMAMMREMMRDAGFRLTVTVEGKIVETNATHRSGSTITLMEMDFGELAEDTTAFRRVMSNDTPAVSSRAAIESLNALPGITLEPQETVTVRYR